MVDGGIQASVGVVCVVGFKLHAARGRDPAVGSDQADHATVATRGEIDSHR